MKDIIMVSNPLNILFPSSGGGLMYKTPASRAMAIIDAGQRGFGDKVPTSSPAMNIRAILDKAGAEAGKQTIIRSVLNRLEGIRQNVIPPNTKWEKTGAYLMLTGQPFKINVSNRGEVSIDAQSESGMPEYADTQKKWILDAIKKMSPLYEKLDFANKKTDLRRKIEMAALQSVQLDNHYPAIKQWEKDYNFYKKLGIPAKIHLDSKGELKMVNQFESNFDHIEDDGERTKLQTAARRLKNIKDVGALRKEVVKDEADAKAKGDKKSSGSATKPWEYLAVAYMKDHDDFFLFINDKGDVDISRNKNSDKLTPKFLLASKDDNPKPEEKWQQEALDLYSQKKAFYFDFDHTGKIKAVENTFLSVSGILSASNKSAEILQARLNMFI